MNFIYSRRLYGYGLLDSVDPIATSSVGGFAKITSTVAKSHFAKIQIHMSYDKLRNDAAIIAGPLSETLSRGGFPSPSGPQISTPTIQNSSSCDAHTAGSRSPPPSSEMVGTCDHAYEPGKVSTSCSQRVLRSAAGRCASRTHPAARPRSPSYPLSSARSSQMRIPALKPCTSRSLEEMRLQPSRPGGSRGHDRRHRPRLGAGILESTSSTTHHHLGENKQRSIRKTMRIRQPKFQALLSASHHGCAHMWRASRQSITHAPLNTEATPHSKSSPKELPNALVADASE